MAYTCEICDKEGKLGSSQKHQRGVAGKRWKKRAQATPRSFKPNLQRVTLKVNDERKQMRICTKCLKRIKKYGSVRQYSNISAV